MNELNYRCPNAYCEYIGSFKQILEHVAKRTCTQRIKGSLIVFPLGKQSND